jgi:hypothetical protein
VIWEGAGTTVTDTDTDYENTYAWTMTRRNGEVVNGTAYYDSISFHKLWKVHPGAPYLGPGAHVRELRRSPTRRLYNVDP